jgi:predicted ATPase/DNA-binding CsgD family transcriptional regulator
MDSSSPCFERLTRRENDILNLLGQNLSNREIAERLVLSLRTVKWYTRQVYNKLGVANRQEAIEKARDLGWLPSGTLAKKPVHTLPRQISSFIGREKEIDQVVKMVCEYPLVTLTGAGGVGKTRLAQVVAGELVDDFNDGIWYVEFASLADPLMVLHVLADTMGIRETPGLRLLDTILLYLNDRQLLLVLDNCEHLVNACAELVQALLTHLPRLKVIVASREPLGVSGEAVFRVPSLSFPKDMQSERFEDYLEFEAVRLFIERARAALPGFELTSANAAAVAQICRRLDGVPLAIEMAAVRVPLLNVQQITQRLDDVFHLLTGGSRSVQSRHRTLHATIDWSYNLLSEEECALLRCLSIFSGGWDLEAAEGVWKGFETGSQANLVSLLGQLVDKSLVQVISREEMRYQMLETIRQFAREKLEDHGEAERARNAHLAYFLTLADRIEPELNGCNQVARLDQLDMELDNLRTALNWGLETDLEAELRLATALGSFFNMRSRIKEGAHWLDQGLVRVEGKSLPLEVRALALAWAGYHHSMMLEYDAAEEMLLESLRIYRGLGPSGKRGVSITLNWLGGNVNVRDPRRAISYLRESLELAREVGDSALTANCLLGLGDDLWKVEPGNPESRRLLQEALDLYLGTGSLDNISLMYFWFGFFALDELDLEQACAWFEKSLPFCQQVRDQDMICLNYLNLAVAARYTGDLPKAIHYLHQVAEIHEHVMSMTYIQFLAYLWLGEIGLIQDDHETARDYLHRALVWAKKMNPKLIGLAQLELGVLAWEEGNRYQAMVECEQASKLLEKETDILTLSKIRVPYSKLLAAAGEKSSAETILRESIANLTSDRAWLGPAIDGLACLTAASQPKRAARLFGLAERTNPYLIHNLMPFERAGRDEALAHVRVVLGEEHMMELWAEGQSVPLKEAAAYALER